MIPVTLLLSLTASLTSPLLEGEAGGSVAPRVRTVAYERLAEEPGSFAGQELRLVLQFHSLEETWNPYLTRFSPKDYVGVRGWTDAQLPWLEAEFDRRPVRVFVARRAAELETFFRQGERHERVAVVGVVREVFAGQPWFEVTAAEVLPESIPEGSVLHAIRALDFEEKHAFGLALGELDRACAAPLPKHAVDALDQIRKRCTATRKGR